MGAKVTILDRETIGKGSVIAVKAVVNKTVVPFTIDEGVSAKLNGKRS